MEGCTLLEGGLGDEQEVVDFLNVHFVPLEPINAAIGLCEPGYRMPYFDAWVSGLLRAEGTVMQLARDSQGTLLGVAICGREESGKKVEEGEEEAEVPRWQRCPEKMLKIFTFLDHLKAGLDVPGQYGVDSWGDLMILACHSNRRVPGLGTALTLSVVRGMEEQGVRVVTTTATSHYSARIFAKMGWTEVKSLAYSDYTEEGRVVFPTTEPHTHARTFVKS